MTVDDAVAYLDGRVDRAIENHDVAAERQRSQEELLRENAEMRATIAGLQEQIDAMRAQFAAEAAALRSEANTDVLTGVLTRRAFEKAAESELARARGSAVSALIVDVDHFKAVNDVGGHAFGDHILAALGQVLQQTFRREGDLVGRIGGEEFAVILPVAHDVAIARAEMLRSALAAADIQRPDEGSLTVSIGVATVRSLEARREELLEAADTALYRAKRAGRDRVVSIEDPEDLDSIVADVDSDSDVDDGYDLELLREVAKAADGFDESGVLPAHHMAAASAAAAGAASSTAGTGTAAAAAAAGKVVAAATPLIGPVVAADAADAAVPQRVRKMVRE